MERRQYAQESLHKSYEVYVPEHDEHSEKQDLYWVIYIHGGAYRDPRILANSFHQTLTLLLSSPLHAHTSTRIAGFASLNYRLSPHPDYPQDPNATPEYELRNAKHPDHIHDIITGIAALQSRYGFGSKYLLVGHSVGATMAMQVALSQSIRWDPHGTGTKVCEPPEGILAVAGNYDYPLLLRTHEPKELYEGFVYGAFGRDAQTLRDVSPSSYLDEYDTNWKVEEGRKRVVVVAHSQGDEYVQMSQPQSLLDVLGRLPKEGMEYRYLELTGRHDAMWSKGEEMARGIGVALSMMEGPTNKIRDDEETDKLGSKIKGTRL